MYAIRSYYVRQGDFILIPPYKGPAVAKEVNIELGNDTAYQLYNLKDDISQSENLAQSNPEKLDEMIRTFKELRGGDFADIEMLELK